MSTCRLKRPSWLKSLTSSAVFARSVLRTSYFVPAVILLVFPASANYRLNEWSIGEGGSDRSGSTNFQSETIANTTGGDTGASTNYQIKPGLLNVQMANEPPAPTLANLNQNYDRLHLVINTGNNPSHTTYAVAISTDNFLTTHYVKADNTVGNTLVASDWRTYASWGNSTGIWIVGLSPNTTYQVKVKAERGDFTESPWGPMTSATTSALNITFDLDVAPTDQETNPPYTVDFGSMNAGSVNTASNKIWVDFSTNANNGGVVFVGGTNGGLKSNANGHTIPSISADLSGQSEGFGVQNASITQSAGGPFTADAPFSSGGNTVGSPGTTLIPLNETATPLTGGRSSQNLKAIINSLTPGSIDYTETLTLVAAGTF